MALAEDIRVRVDPNHSPAHVRMLMYPRLSGRPQPSTRSKRGRQHPSHRERERERGQESVRITAADTRRHLSEAFREVQRISTRWLLSHDCTRLFYVGPTYTPMTREVKGRVFIGQISALFGPIPASLSLSLSLLVLPSGSCFPALVRLLPATSEGHSMRTPVINQQQERCTRDAPILSLALSRCC